MSEVYNLADRSVLHALLAAGVLVAVPTRCLRRGPVPPNKTKTIKDTD